MINFICKYAGIFFCLAGYAVALSTLTLTAIVVPSLGATIIMVAIIIFITGQFIDLLLNELEEL